MKKKALLLECASGISGDMMLGALLDMGADREGLMHLIRESSDRRLPDSPGRN